jgi:hypothetical protein
LSSSCPTDSRSVPSGENFNRTMALRWKSRKLASGCLVSISQTNISIYLAFPAYAIYPVATILREGCIAKLTISSSCLLKKVCCYVLASTSTPSAAAAKAIVLRCVNAHMSRASSST